MGEQMRISERREADGWREIGVRNTAGELVAVITRPCAGADWFLYRMGRGGKERFRARKAALAVACKPVCR